MIKFNWGTGIFIVLSIIVLAVITFYIYLSNLGTHLVEENYYEKELAYQEKIDKLNNTSQLAGNIEILKEPGVVIIEFPSLDTGSVPSGTVWFYRPSDQKKDFTVPLQLNDSLQQAFNVSSIDKGKWIIKIDWEMDGKEYYFEEAVIISH
jgi:hypothetical protein